MYALLITALLFGGAANATDPSTLDVSVEGLPDLMEIFRRHRPIMGDCPVGEVGDSAPIPPGAHLLHLGTSGFYLDYAQRLELTEAQRSALREIRDGSLEAGARLDAAIEDAEHRLWAASGAGAPRQELEAMVREIERLRADQRWGYLEAVERAATALTDRQRAELIGG